ncbi:uncharacterized protein Ecym_3105 [Eremothecium cymbalariae DBVPG|uniref:Uncharacterized protein n=1 Tax=Eremothecium cymbalariae (strain CBS 270.75 / DBVPG 7215 / KCTC 17166 / NRRL Y-17582) TaxID=931890 RepID=G8JR44_ERECY|nr:Hypothetical protein Ecym_3105 [Eremothecium cymbalariae DBVPG\
MVEDLNLMLGSFSERFPYNTTKSLHDIKSSTQLKDSTPLIELGKLAKLLKAQITKAAILSQKSRIAGNETVLTKQLHELEQSLFYLLSLFPKFHLSGDYASYLLKQLDETVLALVQCMQQIYVEIKEGNENLLSVGKLWSLCDELLSISEEGNLGLLKKHISSSTKLVNDTILEIHDWLEDPILEQDDPFGLDGSSGEDNDGADTDRNVCEVASKEMVEFVQKLERKLKLIKLLLGSFNKSVEVEKSHSRAAVEIFDKLNTMHHDIVPQIDEFVSSIFMLGADFDPEDGDIIEELNKLNTSMKQLCKLVRKLNFKNPMKNKWLENWEAQWQKL